MEIWENFSLVLRASLIKDEYITLCYQLWNIQKLNSPILIDFERSADHKLWAFIMSLADTAEALINEYSEYVDLYFNSKDRKRPLKCSFCNRSYKYQQVLNNHVNTQHMDKLKQIDDQERMKMIHTFLLDDTKIMFPEFYRRYFSSSSQ